MTDFVHNAPGRARSEHGSWVISRARLSSFVVGTAFVAFVVLAFVGTTPFNDRVRVDLRDVDTGGDAFRQVFLVGLTLFLLLSRRGPNYRRMPLYPLHLILFGWIFLSAGWSAVPLVVVKRAALTMMTFLLAMLFWQRLGTLRIVALLTGTLASLVLVSLASGLFIPNAVHQASELADIAGDWRGVFPHKNNAGFATMIAIGFTLLSWRQTHRWRWLLILGAEGLFLALTDSKTSMGLTVIMLATTAFFSVMVRARMFRSGISLISLAAPVFLGFLWIVFASEILAVLKDPTSFTNRTYIWQLLLQVWQQTPLLGVGFGSLWQVEDSALAPLLSGGRFAATQGHNAYLDILVTIGPLGLLLTIITIFVMPLTAVLRRKSFDRLDILLVSLTVTMVFYNFMETGVLQFFQPTWLTLSFLHVISIGRRIEARPR